MRKATTCPQLLVFSPSGLRLLLFWRSKTFSLSLARFCSKFLFKKILIWDGESHLKLFLNRHFQGISDVHLSHRKWKIQSNKRKMYYSYWRGKQSWGCIHHSDSFVPATLILLGRNRYMFLSLIHQQEKWDAKFEQLVKGHSTKQRLGWQKAQLFKLNPVGNTAFQVGSANGQTEGLRQNEIKFWLRTGAGKLHPEGQI